MVVTFWGYPDPEEDYTEAGPDGQPLEKSYSGVEETRLSQVTISFIDVCLMLDCDQPACVLLDVLAMLQRQSCSSQRPS